MSATSTVPAHLIETGRDLGLSEADVVAMWERAQPSKPEIHGVTRWARCPECRSNESRTITWAGGSEGAWSCSNDTCWSEYVDTFTFTKAEMAFFEEQERAAE